MSRQRLPNRRDALSTTIELPGWPPLTATVGTDATGRVAEVFLRAAPDTDLDRLLDDAAVLASFALQNGASADQLAVAIARHDGRLSTSIGAALAFAAEIDR